MHLYAFLSKCLRRVLRIHRMCNVNLGFVFCDKINERIKHRAKANRNVALLCRIYFELDEN